MREKRCTYLLPIRRARFDAAEVAELGRYLHSLGEEECEVIVADGSPGEVWAQHHESWSEISRHVEVDRRFGYLNDKVNGIHTGVELASCAKVVLADDDIRYRAAELRHVCELLETCEVVRPQNYLSPLPWWARMEAARMLINRATLRTGDYPGTCAFRRETMLRVGHYDGDVLFDNEEIIRHFASAGARVGYEIDLLVEKRPPRLRKWVEQRPRQAYEDFPLRSKTALFFALPLIALAAWFAGGWRGLLLFVLFTFAGSTALAFLGWRRGIAARFFPLATCLSASLWLWERAFSTYWALYWYLARGGYPFGEKLLSRGVGRDWFRGGRVAATVQRGSGK